MRCFFYEFHTLPVFPDFALVEDLKCFHSFASNDLGKMTTRTFSNSANSGTTKSPSRVIPKKKWWIYVRETSGFHNRFSLHCLNSMFLGLIWRLRSSTLAPTALFSLVEWQSMQQCHIHPRQCRCQRLPPNTPKAPWMVMLLVIDLANLYHWSSWTFSFCWMIVWCFCYCCSISTVLHATDANRCQLLRNRSATHQIRSPGTKPPPHNHELQLEWKEGKDTLKSLPTQKLGKGLRILLAVVLEFCLISSHTYLVFNCSSLTFLQLSGRREVQGSYFGGGESVGRCKASQRHTGGKEKAPQAVQFVVSVLVPQNHRGMGCGGFG